jgi:hypothetical protein
MIDRMHDPRTRQWLTLTSALDRTMRKHAPGWTDHNERGPGITIIEVMAYLANRLELYSTGPARDATTVSRIIRALEAYEQSQPSGGVVHEHWCGVTRPRFFSGQVLTSEDLRDGQEYHRQKHRRHLQTLHGCGVVNGLQVEVGTDGVTITIAPGLAVDDNGEEICLHETITLTIPSDAPSPVSVVMDYAEKLVKPVPVPSEDGTEPSRIEEGCNILLSPSTGNNGVEIARLIRESNAWRLDSSFVPIRLTRQMTHW